MVTSRIASVERTVGALSAKMSTLSLHSYAVLKRMRRPSPVVPTLRDHGTHKDKRNGTPAAGSLGSNCRGSSDDSRNTRRRPDTFSSFEDEQACNSVLLRFLCELYLKEITKWTNNLWEESNMPAENRLATVHCETGSMSVKLVFETKGMSRLCCSI